MNEMVLIAVGNSQNLRWLGDGPNGVKPGSVIGIPAHGPAIASRSGAGASEHTRKGSNKENKLSSQSG